MSSDGSRPPCWPLSRWRDHRGRLGAGDRFNESGKSTAFSVALPFEAYKIPRSTRSEALREYAATALLGTRGSPPVPGERDASKDKPRRAHTLSDYRPDRRPSWGNVAAGEVGSEPMVPLFDLGRKGRGRRDSTGGGEGAKLLDARGPKLWVMVKDQFDVESALGAPSPMGG